MSLPTLHEIGWTREWGGIPSTTQLLNPTRMEYLKVKCDYAIDPFESAFRLLGTRHHQRLEAVAKRIEGLIAEKKMGADEVARHSGILDLLEPDELQDGFWKLIDYKTWGSFSVAKIMGRSENGEYDRRQAELQLNDYRIKAKRLGFPVSRIFVQCTIRDGGTWVARKNEVPEKLSLIPIARLDDKLVEDYFAHKGKILLAALEINMLPPMCDYDGRWGNRRCKGFCSVFKFCPEGRMMNKMPREQGAV